MPALGQRFRAARESRGLTLPEVAEQIRIRSVYLAAIENEDWTAIGAPVYIRGFLRTYARFLGLDAEEVVADFNIDEGERGAIVPTRTDIADTGRGRRFGLPLSPLIWIATAVAIILIAFVVYNELTLPKRGAVAFLATPVPGPSLSPTPAPTSAATLAPSAATLAPSASPGARASSTPLPPSGAQTLSLRLTGPCWLRVFADGRLVAQGTFPAGTTKTFSGRSVSVLVGNAGAADVIVAGKDLGKMGASGQVVQRSFTL